MIKDRGNSNRTYVYLVLAILTAIGTALRLYHLNYQSLWYDELHSIIPTHPGNSLWSIIEYCKGDQPPAFFVYLHYFFKIFGYSEIVGRFASALLGIVAIPVMFYAGKEVRNERAGILAAMLTSLNFMHIYYSQELRFYSMAFLFSALSFLFLIRAFKRAQIVDFFFYVLFTAALLYTHYYGLVIYATQVVIFFILLRFRRDKDYLIPAIISGILPVILFIPWLPVIFNDVKISSFWIQRPAPTFIASYFYYYFGKDIVVTVASLMLTVLFFKQLFNKRPGHQGSVYLILFVWLLLSYLIPYVKSITGVPMLHVRYTIVTLPAWFLIFSVGWSCIENLRWRFGLAGLISVSMVLNLWFGRKHYSTIDKQQFREVSQLVKTKNTASLPVYSPYPWHFNFYFRSHPLQVNSLNDADLSENNMVWVLYAEFFSREERSEIIAPLLKDFEIAESFAFHKTEALLLRRVRKKESE